MCAKASRVCEKASFSVFYSRCERRLDGQLNGRQISLLTCIVIIRNQFDKRNKVSTDGSRYWNILLTDLNNIDLPAWAANEQFQSEQNLPACLQKPPACWFVPPGYLNPLSLNSATSHTATALLEGERIPVMS